MKDACHSANNNNDSLEEKGGWIEQHHYVGRGEWKVCMDSRSWVDMQRENRMVSKLMGEERGEFFLLFFYAITSHRMVLVLGSVGGFFVKKKANDSTSIKGASSKGESKGWKNKG